MASIITAPCAKLMMRSTPKMSERPKATSPYTPPSRRPLTTACRRRSRSNMGARTCPPHPGRLGPPGRSPGGPHPGAAVLAVPLGDGKYRLGLGEARRAHHRGPAVLHLEQRGRGVDVLPGLVELDRVLGQDVVGQVRLGQRVAQLVPVGRARPLQRV